MGFKDDLVIDQYALDTEWMNQPLLYAEWAEKAVDAAFEFDKAKQRLEIVSIELEKDIRSNPEKYGISKVTEGSVASELSYRISQKSESNEVLEAKRNQKMMEVARESFDQRKKALENLTSLFLSKYYAEPYVPQKAKQAIEGEAQAGCAKALNEAMERRPIRRRGDG